MSLTVTRAQFFEAADIDKLLEAANIVPPNGLHYAAKDDPRYQGPNPAKPPKDTYADSLAERCARDLHWGLEVYVRRRLALDSIKPNSEIRKWAEEIEGLTTPLLEKLGFQRQAGKSFSEMKREFQQDEEGSSFTDEEWLLAEEHYPTDVFTWVDRTTEVLGRFQEAAVDRRMEIEGEAGLASKLAFGSGRVGAAEVWQSIQAVRVLHEVAVQTKEFSRVNPSKRGRKSSLNAIFRSIMETYEALTDDYASIPTNAMKDEDRRYGPELDFTLATLAMARTRLVDGALSSDGEPISLERFRQELENAATPDAIEKRFREINKLRREEEAYRRIRDS